MLAAAVFDAYVWLEQTTAVTPLGPEHARPGLSEIYPFWGVRIVGRMSEA